MPGTGITAIRGKRVERVGVIFVHGIGEQTRFQHLEAETRQVIDAIIANYGAIRSDVTTTLETGEGDAFRGAQSSWASGAKAPLHAIVEFDVVTPTGPDTRIVDVAFHEVWWADINEPLTLMKQVRFWLWGLSIPGIVENNEIVLATAREHMRAAIPGFRLNLGHRLRLACVAGLFAISALSIAWVNMLLKRLNFDPLLSTGTIVNYLSAVKIYTQSKRAGGSPLDGPDEPPRAAIRRRMVRAIYDVATADYDRWYILAHSLGSVVAFNALMETKEALPNYLSVQQWVSSAAVAGLRGRSPEQLNGNEMMPIRPLWLDDYDVLDRETLFGAFRGILTYGAPLERFAGLWGASVPINTHEDVFSDAAEWVNVYDPTDPVGTWLANFDPIPPAAPRAGYGTLQPQSFPCRSSPILLLSHIRYLANRRLFGGEEHLLVNRVAAWLVEGRSLAAQIDAAPKGYFTFWMWRYPAGTPLGWLRGLPAIRRLTTPGRAFEGLQVWPRRIWRYVQWVLVGLVLSWLGLKTLHLLWTHFETIRQFANWLWSLVNG